MSVASFAYHFAQGALEDLELLIIEWLYEQLRDAARREPVRSLLSVS
jgi:hypothetical protein